MSRTKLDLLFSIGLTLLIAWAVSEVRDWPPRTRVFPLTLGLPILGLGLLQCFMATRALLKPAGQAPRSRQTSAEPVLQTASTVVEVSPEAEQDQVDPRLARKRALEMLGWTLAFFFGIWLFGFKIGSAVLTFLFLKLGAKEGMRISATLAAGTYLFFMLLFDIGLKVPLPNGVILESLGLQSPDWYLINAVLNLFRGS